MSDRQSSAWSVLTYDIKTAVDVCGIPCLLNTSSRVLPDEELLPLSTKIKLESEVVLYTAHIRVIDYDDPDWIRQTKGRDFYNDRRQFLGCELLIPLSYPGLVRLHQSKTTKSYFNISEVAEDFPRLVRVEEEIAGASPGEPKPQLVKKGALLQVDRLTKSTRMIRGMSEAFLMFFEVGTGKAFGFPLHRAVHFTEVVDTFKYTLKEIVDQLPLPRRVQFVSVNPYDIIVAEDGEALELMTIFDGPIEILGIRRLEMLVGIYLSEETGNYEMVAIPKDDSILEDIRVHIPISCIGDSDVKFAETEMPTRTKRDLLKNKLYALYVDDLMPVFLRNRDSSHEYKVTDTALAPPVPPRRYDNPPMATAHSDTQINDPDRFSFVRRRFKSLGDVTRYNFDGNDISEGNGVRGFFKSMSRRLRKRRGSEDINISLQEVSENGLLRRLSSFKQSLSSLRSVEPPETFVCYLNSMEELGNITERIPGECVSPDLENERKNVCENNSTNPNTSNESLERRLDGQSYVYLGDNLSINTVDYNAENDKNEIIYATVNWKSKQCGVVEVRKRFNCDICKFNFLNPNSETELKDN